MKVVFGPFCGEIGWELCYWQAHGRWLKQQLPDYQFCISTFPGRQAFYRDFAERVLAHTPTKIRNFGNLNCYNGDDFKREKYFKYVDKLLTKTKAYTAFTTPNYNGRFYIPWEKMIFKRFKPMSQKALSNFFPLEEIGSPAVMIFPRHKSDERDWGEKNWQLLCDLLVDNGYWVVIAGIKINSCLAYYRRGKVVNLVKLGADVHHTLDLTLYYMDRVNVAIGSQSFLPILSLHQGIPTLVWGAEKERHQEELNFFKTPCNFIEDFYYDLSIEKVWKGFEELKWTIDK